jgi:hypothetical protein
MSEEAFDALMKKYSLNPKIPSVCGPGWLPILDELFDKLIKLGWDRDVHQIKEKFGKLRIYIGPGTDEMRRLVHEAEDKSNHVCEECGKPGTNGASKTGWFRTLCEKCRGR